MSDYRRSLNKKSPRDTTTRTSGGPGLLPTHDGERHALPVRLGAHHTALHPAAVAPPHMPAVNATVVVVINIVVVARGTTAVLTVTTAAAHELLLALTMLQQQQGLCHVIVVDAGVDVAHAHGGVSADVQKPHAVVVVVVFLSGGGHDAGGGLLTRFPGYDDFAKGLLHRRRKSRRRGEKRRMETSTAAVGVEFAEKLVEVDVAVRVEQVGLAHVPKKSWTDKRHSRCQSWHWYMIYVFFLE
jgi:hypothetical protein